MTVDAASVTTRPADGPTTAPRTAWWSTALFAATSFLGAGLLFVVQPMVARLVLPQFGGSATVWSTSSLFFQVVLLVGYLYSHAATRSLGRRAQPVLHLGLLLLPLMVLPIALAGGDQPADSSPVWWLLRTLALTVGLPFAVVSTTGPLLQRWYSWTVGRRSEDPYFLFATSNLGSFVGLLAYPFVVEPLLTLDQQRHWWSIGYGVFVVLMAGSALVALTSRAKGVTPPPATGPGTSTGRVAAASRVPAVEVLRWLGLAFLPSSLMLGVTAHISTDVAAIPLMWVVPLAIYLATFVVAFARTSRTVDPRWPRAAAATAAVALMAWLVSAGLSVGLMILVDLAVLATTAYAAHATLAARRPAAEHLTFFYIVVAVGGALGGLLNGVLAPVLLNDVWEYPAVLVATIALALPHGRPPFAVLSRRYHPAFVGVVESALLLIGLMLLTLLGANVTQRTSWLAVPVLLLWALAGVLASRRPLPLLAAGVAFVLIPIVVGPDTLVRDRSFYGAYTVTEGDGWRTFQHGTTVHGRQALDERSTEPSTYYSRSGPVGKALDVLDRPADLALVGLGVGTLAAYGEAGQRMTFFEIDPDVVEVASDPDLFTYLADTPADVEIVVGDGRLRLEDRAPGSFDVLVLDAFTSDAIPAHLLTLEAFESYAEVLREDGLLLVHVSNRVFDLEPVVAAAAHHLRWEAALGTGSADETSGATDSVWIALSPDPALVGRLADDDSWRPIGSRQVAWTDNYSSVLTVLRGL